jgi:hypothetical protein
MGVIMDSSLRWINAEELKNRWNMKDFEIAKNLSEFDLKPFDTRDERTINIKELKKIWDLDEDHMRNRHVTDDAFMWLDFVIYQLQYLMFNLNEIELFEMEHSNKFHEDPQRDVEVEIKLRPSQKHRERCRAIAELIWQSNSDITIEDMAKKDEIKRIGCENNGYTVKTIREWIKDLCPNRKPGRRPEAK